jgi:hypothetical protein
MLALHFVANLNFEVIYRLDCGLDDQEVWVQFPVGARDFLHNVQTGSVTHRDGVPGILSRVVRQSDRN